MISDVVIVKSAKSLEGFVGGFQCKSIMYSCDWNSLVN